MRDIPRPALDAPVTEWQVYSDALQEAGDPRGELIALSIGGDPAARDRFAREHWGKLVGDVPPSELTVEWHYDSVRRATLRPSVPDNKLVEQVLALPAMRELRAIELRGAQRMDLDGMMSKLAERMPPTLRDFAFVDERAQAADMLVSRDFDPPNNLVAFGDFAPFFARAEALTIHCADANQLTIADVVAPELRSFTLRTLRMCEYDGAIELAATLGRAQWPKLEAFELRCCETFVANVPEEHNPYVPVYSADDWDGEEGSEEGECDGIDWNAALGPLLRNLAKGPLRRLALTSFVSATSMLNAIAEAGLAPTVRELDLSDSMIEDAHVAWMLERRALFAKLETLRLERTPLDDSAALDGLGPKIVHTSGTGATYRYVVGAE
jgi:hypothetical protein